MNRLTHKEALLLAVSGELSPAARREIMAQVAQDPSLNSDYHDVREGMDLLSSLAIPEPSAEERQRIPATIKKSIHNALRQKQASRWSSLARYAAGAIAATVTLAVLVGFWSGEKAHNRRQQGQVAALNASIRQIESITTPASLPLAFTDAAVPVAASMPSLANLRDRDSFSSFIWNAHEISDEPPSDPSSPPGSY